MREGKVLEGSGCCITTRWAVFARCFAKNGTTEHLPPVDTCCTMNRFSYCFPPDFNSENPESLNACTAYQAVKR